MIDYSEIDPGVRRLVRWLNERGYETCDSGDGSKAPEMECAFAVANVTIEAHPASLANCADMLRHDLGRLGIAIVPMGSEGEDTRCIQAGYCPATGRAWIDLFGVSDADLPAGIGEAP